MKKFLFSLTRVIIQVPDENVDWNGAEKKVIATLDSNTVEFSLGKNKAEVKGIDTKICFTNFRVVPAIINGRTMLLIRFPDKNLGCNVQ